MKYIILILFGVVVGMFLGDFLAGNPTPPKVVTKIEYQSDTVYITIRDTVRIKQVKQEFLRDTVLIDYKPQIKAFTASTPFLYGNTYVSGEVLGEVLKMDITNDFKIPTVTNTIKETTTITKMPAGLFVTAGIAKGDSQLSPYVGAIFVKDRYLIGLNTQSIQFGYRIR